MFRIGPMSGWCARGVFPPEELAVKQSRLIQCGVLVLVIGVSAAARGANELDKIVVREQQATGLKLETMPVVSDAVFLRRIYVDLIGRIPTESEVRHFATQPATTRRAALVDELLKDE